MTRARVAEVDAVETGCLGRELRRGGDFFGKGAIMLAFSKGLLEVGVTGAASPRIRGDFGVSDI